MKIADVVAEIRRSLADLASDIEWRGPDLVLAPETEGRKSDLRVEIAEEGVGYSVSLRLAPMPDDIEGHVIVCERAVVNDQALVLLLVEEFIGAVWRAPGKLPRAF